MELLILTKYGRLGASSRLRSLQYIPWLQQAGFHIKVQTLISDDYLQTRYKRRSYTFISLLISYTCRVYALLQRHKFDVVWIEKEALPWAPLWLERALLQDVPYVLDYDDAIFHNYDQHPSFLVRYFFGRRLDKLMANASLVVGGNNYLAQRARDAGAPCVEVVPTVIDLLRYPYPLSRNPTNALLRVVWIGTPTTVRYLQLLREPLQILAVRRPFVLRIIGGGEVDLPGVQMEIIPWTESSEVANISTGDVGIMPLLDTPWERGKCGYKLIQYMACGLPVVASAIGVNSEIVKHGVNGFLATTSQEWVNTLDQLLMDQSMRTQMGSVGRQMVEQTFCIQQTGSQLADLLHQVATRH